MPKKKIPEQPAATTAPENTQSPESAVETIAAKHR